MGASRKSQNGDVGLFHLAKELPARQTSTNDDTFLSLMLGVRRAGVTVALNYLEQRAIIRLARKQIVITDRKGLEAAANGSYHKPEKQA